MICDNCDRSVPVLTEVEQDSERMRICDRCMEEGVGFDLMVRVHFDPAVDPPQPKEFDWSE